jgi:hypothetical protein
MSQGERLSFLTEKTICPMFSRTPEGIGQTAGVKTLKEQLLLLIASRGRKHCHKGVSPAVTGLPDLNSSEILRCSFCAINRWFS